MATPVAPTGYCPGCGYRINPGVCPECGRQVAQVDPDDPRSLARRTSRLFGRIFIASILATGLGCAALNTILEFWPLSQLNTVSKRSDWLCKPAQFLLDWRWEREQAKAEVQASRIEDEAMRLGSHPWAGVYDSEFGRVYIAPSRGFVEYSSSYGGLGLTRYGVTTELPSNRLHLTSGLDSFSINEAPDQIFIHIRWGERSYIVPESKMTEYCAKIREGLHYSNSYYCRLDRGGPPARGLPAVPGEYQHLMPPMPVCATVTNVVVEQDAVESDSSGLVFRHWRVRATLNAGRKQGFDRDTLTVGLFGSLPDGYNIWKVSDDSCEVQYECETFPDQPFQPPQVGWLYCIEPQQNPDFPTLDSTDHATGKLTTEMSGGP